MTAYYNENDPFAAAWLRELIKEKVIADGQVDTRSIEDVYWEDVKDFTQCHWFAGIGVWSYALRLAGWPDDRPVWTGSCPCPSFSAAGKGKGFNDPRHLWPTWARLIWKCKPAVIFGEQVDDAIGHGWLDLVQTDLEGASYAVGKAVFGACSVGAPQISSRLYFVAEAEIGRLGVRGSASREAGWPAQRDTAERVAEAAGARRNETIEASRSNRLPLFSAQSEQRSGPRSMAQAECDGRRTDEPWRKTQERETDGRSSATGPVASPHGREPGDGHLQRSRQHGLFTQNSSARSVESTKEHCERPGLRAQGSREKRRGRSDHAGSNGSLGATASTGLSQRIDNRGIPREEMAAPEGQGAGSAGPVDGFWRDAEWIFCTDGKYRATKPGIFPLAHGVTGRVGKLRGYGNALVAPQAQAFIEAYLGIYSALPQDKL